jgi:hypothetical protein
MVMYCIQRNQLRNAHIKFEKKVFPMESHIGYMIHLGMMQIVFEIVFVSIGQQRYYVYNFMLLQTSLTSIVQVLLQLIWLDNIVYGSVSLKLLTVQFHVLVTSQTRYKKT